MANTDNKSSSTGSQQRPPQPQHPATSAQNVPGTFNDVSSKPTVPADNTPSKDLEPSSSQPQSAQTSSGSSFLKRAFSKPNRTTTKRFFSAYAQTWLGLSPIWLMSEALSPSKKVGTQFSKGRRELMSAAQEVREMVATSGKDVVVIIDEKLRLGTKGEGGKQVAERTAEVIKAAGENAILVVTTSLDKLSSQFSSSKDGTSRFDLHRLASDPALKRSLKAHSRDALVLLDKSLKHPVVITGVSRFTRSRGIPHADALLRLASLGLNRILRAMPVPEEVAEEVEGKVEAKIEEVEEIDAEELERRSTQEDKEEAESIGKAADSAPAPRVEGGGREADAGPYAEMKKKNECMVM